MQHFQCEQDRLLTWMNFRNTLMQCAVPQKLVNSFVVTRTSMLLIQPGLIFIQH